LGGAQKWLTDDGLWDIFLNSRVLGGAQIGWQMMGYGIFSNSRVLGGAQNGWQVGYTMYMKTQNVVLTVYQILTWGRINRIAYNWVAKWIWLPVLRVQNHTHSLLLIKF
jgi:hypothetical protein